VTSVYSVVNANDVDSWSRRKLGGGPYIRLAREEGNGGACEGRKEAEGQKSVAE